MTDGPSSYAESGVDVAAGERAVDLMRASVAAAQRPEVVGGLGGFAGLFDASALRGYRRPLLATATDGVGTKIAVARALGIHDTIGRDLVAMVVDDLVVTGAEPLFLTDYIACGQVDPERIATIVGGIAAGCAEAGCALLGGETAEHPGLMAPDEYDLAAAGTAVVEADQMLGPDRVQAGDVVIGLASSGLHSNGYSLARAVLMGDDPSRLEVTVPELGRTVGEELLEPTRIYTTVCLDMIRTVGGIHALSHITGGGLAANLARVLPQGMTAHLDRGTWTPAPIFDLLARTGDIARAEMEVAFNMGIGMVTIADPRVLATLFTRYAGWGLTVLGQVRVTEASDISSAAPKGGSGGVVVLTGDHPN
ncbi:MAG: phosphoribosylformylglycinamidine cyclo-ligase [Candidatus Nanopelagicales bacterium]